MKKNKQTPFLKMMSHFKILNSAHFSKDSPQQMDKLGSI